MKYKEVLEAIKSGECRESIILSLEAQNKSGGGWGYGLSRRRAAEIYREYKAKFDNPAIQISDKYTWNKETDKYIIPLKCRKAPLVISRAKHCAICRDYSAWHGDLTAHDVCVKYSLTPEIFNEYRRIFNLTKEREPLSAEEVWEDDEDDSVESILEQKRYSIYQKYEQEDWKATQKDAEKWRAFEARQLDPFSRFLDSWSPPKYVKVSGSPKIQPKNPSKQVLLINVNDIHVGAKADERFLYRQRNWRHSDLQAAMASYFLKIEKEMADRKNPPNQCVVNMGGDILHTLTGFTDNGTKLDYEFLGEDQLEFAFALLTLFFNNLLTVFPKISVKSVSGNHSYFGDYTIARMLELFYKTEGRIGFEITSKRYLPYKILDTLVVLEHGATGKGIKSKVPKGAAKESYVKSILLDRPEMLVGVKSKIFVSNDLHHYEHTEKSDFDMIICPSIVGGDLYSDFNGWKSRPAQCVFVIDEDGLKETIRFYFD